MGIMEMATANIRSDMNAAVNMETSWGKSLEMLPQFTIKEIEQHRQLSGKTLEPAIIKTLDRGRKFKNERFITSDSIFTKCDKSIFYVKGLCKARMKKEKRSVVVKLSTTTSKVLYDSCSCPAGKSGYCNHVMALLLELANQWTGFCMITASVMKELHLFPKKSPAQAGFANGVYLEKPYKKHL